MVSAVRLVLDSMQKRGKHAYLADDLKNHLKLIEGKKNNQ